MRRQRALTEVVGERYYSIFTLALVPVLCLLRVDLTHTLSLSPSSFWSFFACFCQPLPVSLLLRVAASLCVLLACLLLNT